MTWGVGANMSYTCDAMTALSAGSVPLYVRCTIFTPATKLKSSAARCVEEPVAPEAPEAQLSTPGLVFAYAIKSIPDFSGTIDDSSWMQYPHLYLVIND